MFKKYKLKYIEMFYNNSIPIYIYKYKNCSIGKSAYKSRLCVSICPHGKNTSQLPLEKDEIEGILRYLGLNPDKDYRYSTVRHPYSTTQGDTHYYMQQVSSIEMPDNSQILIPSFFNLS